jgi:hypothetical protein
MNEFLLLAIVMIYVAVSYRPTRSSKAPPSPVASGRSDYSSIA